MIYITTATGERHVELARRLEASFFKWDWPRLIVATGDEHPELDDLWKGRGLKTRFAHFIPEGYEGPVAFVDCDCEAVGPYPGDPEVPEGGMSGLILQRLKTPDGNARMNFFASTFLVFGSVEIARKVSTGWFEELKKDKRELTDENALHRVTKYLDGFNTGWFKQPMENLLHLAETHPIN